MTTSVIMDQNQVNGCPVDTVKVSKDLTLSGSYQYENLPEQNGSTPIMITVTTDTNMRVQLVGASEDAADGRAIAIRVPAAGLRDFTIYARKKRRLAYKTL